MKNTHTLFSCGVSNFYMKSYTKKEKEKAQRLLILLLPIMCNYYALCNTATVDRVLAVYRYYHGEYNTILLENTIVQKYNNNNYYSTRI